MSETKRDQLSASGLQTVPWHLWVVGVVSLLWNSMGVLDFTMTATRNEAYMSGFTQEQLNFFYGFPAWLIVFWAIAVGGGLMGSILLLSRSKWAVPVFGASLVSMVVTAIHNYGFDKMLEISGTFGAVFTGVIFVISVLLLWYAMAMRQRGVLK